MGLAGGVFVFKGVDITDWIDLGTIFSVGFLDRITPLEEVREKVSHLKLSLVKDFPHEERNQRIFLRSDRWRVSSCHPLIKASLFIDSAELPSETLLSQMRAELHKGLEIIARYYQTDIPEELEEPQLYMIAYSEEHPDHTHSSPESVSFCGTFDFGIDVSSWIREYALFDPQKIKHNSYEDTWLCNEFEDYTPTDDFAHKTFGRSIFCSIPHEDKISFFCFFKSGPGMPFDVDFVSDHSVHGDGGVSLSSKERIEIEQSIDAFHSKVAQYFNVDLPRPPLRILLSFEFVAS